jgi:hypothetical protein
VGIKTVDALARLLAHKNFRVTDIERIAVDIIVRSVH